MRVTHVVFDLDGGGFETLVASMARSLALTATKVSVVSLSGRVGRVGRSISGLLDQYHTIRSSPILSMLVPVQLSRTIERTRADIVHIHSGCWYKAAIAARRAGVTGVVYTEHGREHNDPLVARWIDQLAARRTDLVVAVSARLADYLVRCVGVPRERVCTINNGVDTARFCPGTDARSLRRRLSIPDEAVVVGSVGRLETVKAYERLVDAVAWLRQSGAVERPVVGLLWGDGSQREVLRSRIVSRGLAGAFHLPGWTDDTPAAHRTLDVFVLTSSSEGASVSLMEALASGTPPVVTDVGANSEILGPELRRQVVAPMDDLGLRTTLVAMLNDQDRRRQLGEIGRRRIEQRYTLGAMVNDYMRVYDRILHTRYRVRGGGAWSAK